MDRLKWTLVFAVLGLHEFTGAFRWSPSFPDQTQVPTCEGKDAFLRWTIDKDAGEQLDSVRWYYHSDSGSLLDAPQHIASLIHGHFVPFSGYAERLRYLPDAGLELRQVLPSDAGVYTVQATSHGANGSHFMKDSRSAIIDVGEIPSTVENYLAIEQKEEAVYDNATGKMSIQLRCGQFINRGKPPVRVLWATPDQGTVESSGYTDDGYFYLMLPFHAALPDPNGDNRYYCLLATDVLSSLCLSDSSRLLLSNVLSLDVGKAKRTLEKVDPQVQKAELSQQIQELKAKIQDTNSHLSQLDQTKEKLSNELRHHIELCQTAP